MISLTVSRTACYSLLVPKKKDHITLNFSERFLERLREYATRNGMKINAVLKKAFELLEDQEYR